MSLSKFHLDQALLVAMNNLVFFITFLEKNLFSSIKSQSPLMCPNCVQVSTI